MISREFLPHPSAIAQCDIPGVAIDSEIFRTFFLESNDSAKKRTGFFSLFSSSSHEQINMADEDVCIETKQACGAEKEIVNNLAI